jgi:hypothetical protein
MSESLKPADFGLPEVQIVRYKTPKLCRLCGDEFLFYRWGGNNYCPDCDIKRMKRIGDSMKEVAKSLEQPRSDEGKE